MWGLRKSGTRFPNSTNLRRVFRDRGRGDEPVLEDTQGRSETVDDWLNVVGERRDETQVPQEATLAQCLRADREPRHCSKVPQGHRLDLTRGYPPHLYPTGSQERTQGLST